MRLPQEHSRPRPSVLVGEGGGPQSMVGRPLSQGGEEASLSGLEWPGLICLLGAQAHCQPPCSLPAFTFSIWVLTSPSLSEGFKKFNIY